MSISKLKKQETILKYRIHDKDTGSCVVQIPILSIRINNLTEHLKLHKHDHHTRRGLLVLVGTRRRLMRYFKKVNIDGYKNLINDLGIRG